MSTHPSTVPRGSLLGSKGEREREREKTGSSASCQVPGQFSGKTGKVQQLLYLSGWGATQQHSKMASQLGVGRHRARRAAAVLAAQRCLAGSLRWAYTAFVGLPRCRPAVSRFEGRSIGNGPGEQAWEPSM